MAQLNNIERLSGSFKGVFKPLQQFSELYEKAKANPDSVINHMKYEKALEGFYWAWPYGITGEEIRNILEKCQIEIDFDQQMCQYFSEQKMRDIFQDTYNGLPEHHKMLFKQVERAYWHKDYAIANNAFMSIIDNLLKKYMCNPCNVQRQGIMEPMTHYYGMYTPKEAPFYLRMEMLSHCINFIFQNYDFSNALHIETNKKANRHIAIHGLEYSNQQIDTIFLINTIYEILYNQKYLKPFEGTIIISKKSKKAELEEKKIDLVKGRIRDSEIINLSGS